MDLTSRSKLGFCIVVWSFYTEILKVKPITARCSTTKNTRISIFLRLSFENMSSAWSSITERKYFYSKGQLCSVQDSCLLFINSELLAIFIFINGEYNLRRQGRHRAEIMFSQMAKCGFTYLRMLNTDYASMLLALSTSKKLAKKYLWSIEDVA